MVQGPQDEHCVELFIVEGTQLASVRLNNRMRGESRILERFSPASQKAFGKIDERNFVAASRELEGVASRPTPDVADSSARREVFLNESECAAKLDLLQGQIEATGLVVDMGIVELSDPITHDGRTEITPCARGIAGA